MPSISPRRSDNVIVVIEPGVTAKVLLECIGALLQLVTAMNLFGTVYCCKAVVSIMKSSRS